MKQRDKRFPLTVPLTPVVVAIFFACRDAGLPVFVTHTVYAMTFAVFVLGTYLMSLRNPSARSDMAKALSGGSMADETQLIPIDLMTHWLPFSVLVYDYFWAHKYDAPPLVDLKTVLVAIFLALGAYAYTAVVDTEFMYQMDDSKLVPFFVGAFGAFYTGAPQVCSFLNGP